MCGICGWIDSQYVDRSILEKMTQELYHRGPNAQQIEIFGNVGLGHSRLSIIDLSQNANQPMHNEDKSLWLVYNGEFYNFRDYRDELIKNGHIFQSRTDTEVLLHLFEDEGIKCLEKVRGMFTFAFWDQKEKELVLARDRVGIKPLYYYFDGNNFIFASELKAILKHPGVPRQIDMDSLCVYFRLGYIPQEMSIFRDIRKLLPGHYLRLKNHTVRIERYWGLPQVEVERETDEDALADHLYTLLDESVRLRLVSDVPLGIFLSGGIDSSIVASLAAQNSSAPIKTFSIGFDSEKYNELPYARRIANHIGSEHHELIVSIDEVDVIEKLVVFFDEPFADSSAIPTYYVSKMAREFVIVSLTGDGGDELFGGYNWYSWMLLKNKFDVVPLSLRKALSFMSSIPKNDFRGQHFIKSIGLCEFDAFVERVGFFRQEELNSLLKFGCDGYFDFYKEFYTASGRSLLERLTRTDFAFYLPDDILVKVDRASMAVALEARVPLLDHKICEFAFSLPDSVKIHGKIKKYLLKKIARKLLPRDFPLERKQGFSIPLSEWMRSRLGDMFMDLIKSETPRLFLNGTYLENIFRDHKAGRNNNANKLWSVLIFCLWLEKFYHGQ